MGVTIHFEGKLSSPENYKKLISIAKNFAERNGLEFSLFEDENKLLQRVKNEQVWDYEGPTKGIEIQPDENCDPLILEFDEDHYLQEFCKTQFADISVHILIIDFLRQIEPLFENLLIEDEGEYWDTMDIYILQQHIDNCFQVLDEAKKEDPRLNGPYRLSDKRIVDLIQKD